MQSAQLTVDVPPGHPGAPLGDPDQEQGEPAEQDVGADAGFEPVEHRAQLDGATGQEPGIYLRKQGETRPRGRPQRIEDP